MLSVLCLAQDPVEDAMTITVVMSREQQQRQLYATSRLPQVLLKFSPIAMPAIRRHCVHMTRPGSGLWHASLLRGVMPPTEPPTNHCCMKECYPQNAHKYTHEACGKERNRCEPSVHTRPRSIKYSQLLGSHPL